MRIRLALILALASSGLLAQTFSSLEERMSEAEFKASGLDKLSEEELAALNLWLRDKNATVSALPAVAPPIVDRRGLNDSGSNNPIVSRIPGEFSGWDGSKTVFKLENGQVWKSTDPSARLAVKLNDPVVVINPGVLNAWFLKVEGYNAKVRVIRVK